jgi:hypothetical protein
MARKRNTPLAAALKRKPPGRITEDDPRWDPATMGNKRGWKNGVYYVNGKAVRRGPKAT